MTNISELIVLISIITATISENDESCSNLNSCSENHNKYSKELNQWTSNILKEIRSAVVNHEACEAQNCSCHKFVIDQDLNPFNDGITKDMFTLARAKATTYQFEPLGRGNIGYIFFSHGNGTGVWGSGIYYGRCFTFRTRIPMNEEDVSFIKTSQILDILPEPLIKIIDGKLYRQKDCHFPARCAGVEHYLKALAPKLPNMELAINTRDWPQVNHAWGHTKAPVFSFSKTKDYYDIMYPAWSFWEGGPAIALYPTGIGRWDKHRLSISAASDRWPWSKKEPKAFFRGSRTSEERDALVRLSREMPHLVDAHYTKNQAWKSKADTLNAEPAVEVSFEDHCKYKYLFNYRGVAASFRFKHLFLCKSLVFHVGNDWQEFFYPSLKAWVHYIPLNPKATQSEIAKYIKFFQENDSLAQEIANRGYQLIWENLTAKDVKCYWRQLLKKYNKLVKYDIVKDEDLIQII